MTKEAEKKAIELRRLLVFQNACPDCPRSPLTQPVPPAPDGYFADCKLGIEITEYSLQQGKHGSLPRQQETVHQRIAQEAQSLFEPKLSRPLQVNILWTIFTRCPAVREEGPIAQAIAQQVYDNTLFQSANCRVSWKDINDPLFTKYGIEISICPICGVGKSCWSSMACFSFPPEGTRIQMVLDDKESRVSGYRQSCNRVWLLIVADRNFFSSQFTPNLSLSQIRFTSSFDRAFLLKEPQNQIYEFQIER